MWIEGLNPLKDIPSTVPSAPDGRPVVSMEVDASKFVAFFVRGDVEPSDAALDAMVSAFVESMKRVEGVAVTSEPL